MPLLKAASNYKKEAVHLNCEILKYVQRQDQDREVLLTEYQGISTILRLVMENYQALRNEVYCQVLKTMKGSNDA